MTVSGEPETARRAKNRSVLADLNTKLIFEKGKKFSPDEQCDFMYYKIYDMSNAGFKNGTDLEKYVRDEILRTGVWKMDSSARRIGNDGAFTFVEEMEERMAKMEKKFDEQKEKTAEQAKELAEQKEKTAEQAKELAEQKEKTAGRNRRFWKVRVSELERIIRKTHNRSRFERNEIVHGADILSDYQALEHANRLDNQAQFTIASKGFKKAYGLELDFIKYNTLSKAPEEIIDILCLRGNLSFLNWFSNHHKEVDVIRKQCDAAVDKWLESTWEGGRQYPKQAVKADYEQVKTLYNYVRVQKIW